MNLQQQDDDYPYKLVAFLDILGFKQLILQDTDKALQSINFIDERLAHIINVLQQEHDKTFSTKLFSDCICLSCSYTSDNLFNILYELAFIQFYFSHEGIFLRGAISKGNHFENNRMIFSHGLIKAYELEQSAVYPRIIIDAELISEIKGDDKFYYVVHDVGFKKQDFLTQSPDGHFIVDYLHMIYEECMDPMEELQRHKDAIIKTVQQNKDNIKVIEKYRWLSEYHNYKFYEAFNPEEWEENYSAVLIKNTSIDLQTIFPQFKKYQGAATDEMHDNK
jgi:hypothetical protein